MRVRVSKNDAERFALAAVLAAVGASELSPGGGTAGQWMGVACIVGAAALVLVNIVQSVRHGVESTTPVPLANLPPGVAMVGFSLLVAFLIGTAGVARSFARPLLLPEVRTCEAEIVGKRVEILPRGYIFELEVDCPEANWRQEFPVRRAYFSKVTLPMAVQVQASPERQEVLRITGAKRVIWDSYDVGLIVGPSLVFVWIALREFMGRFLGRPKGRRLVGKNEST